MTNEALAQRVPDDYDKAATAPESALTGAMHELRAELETLEKSNAVHLERITPILKPVDPSPASTAELRADGHSELVNAVSELSSQVRSIRCRLEDTTGRVEL